MLSLSMPLIRKFIHTVNAPAWIFRTSYYALCRGKSRLIRSQVVLAVLVMFYWDPLIQLQPVWVDTVDVSQYTTFSSFFG